MPSASFTMSAAERKIGTRNATGQIINIELYMVFPIWKKRRKKLIDEFIVCSIECCLECSINSDKKSLFLHYITRDSNEESVV